MFHKQLFLQLEPDLLFTTKQWCYICQIYLNALSFFVSCTHKTNLIISFRWRNVSGLLYKHRYSLRVGIYDRKASSWSILYDRCYYDASKAKATLLEAWLYSTGQSHYDHSTFIVQTAGDKMTSWQNNQAPLETGCCSFSFIIMHLWGNKNGATTLSIKTLSKTTFSITTVSIVALNTVMLSVANKPLCWESLCQVLLLCWMSLC